MDTNLSFSSTYNSGLVYKATYSYLSRELTYCLDTNACKTQLYYRLYLFPTYRPNTLSLQKLGQVNS